MIVRVHCDTEFTDFVKSDLISIGLASASGETFYAENRDFDRSLSSEWVVANIYPLLNLDRYGQRREELAASVSKWLSDLPADKIIITVDYPTDWHLLSALVGKHPKIEKCELLFRLFHQWAQQQAMVGGYEEYKYVLHLDALNKAFVAAFEEHFLDETQFRHHALADAKANLVGYNRLVREHGLPL